MLKIVKLIIFFSLFGCASSQLRNETRKLSEEEIKKYELYGVINEAKICPTKFDSKINASVVIGRCEIVSCNLIDGKQLCIAKFEN